MILKLKNRNQIYYRRDGNKLGKQKYTLLCKRQLLPTVIGNNFNMSVSITDLSKYMQCPVNMDTSNIDENITNIDIFNILEKIEVTNKPLSRKELKEAYKIAKDNNDLIAVALIYQEERWYESNRR